MGGIHAALFEHAFEHLFIEYLGWDRLRGALTASWKDETVQLTTLAQKRGFAVLHCSTHRTVLANRQLLREIQRQVRRNFHEHIIIYSCKTPRKQVWQWVIEQDGRRLRHREHPFFSDRPPKRLLNRIEGLEIRLDEEKDTTLLDVLNRVRAALMPDSEQNLFARKPWYAKESDRLAMAMKRGEPGAFEKFCEFHLPLARKASRMLVRWFDMDAEDAEQTAMIGILKAAQRFDPERGYQFSTIAGYYLRHVCQRYGLEWGLPIRVPVHVFWPCYKLAFIEAELVATYGEHEAQAKFEQELKDAGVTPEQWAQFRRARHIDCLSAIDRDQRPIIAEPDEIDQAISDACKMELRQHIRSAMADLNPRQVQILSLRYGLDGPEHTLLEVGNLLGITRERVRQIQAKAEEKLQQLMLKIGYHDLLISQELHTQGDEDGET